MDIMRMRHSTAHVMAAAVCRLFDEVKLDIGPATDSGFYYDFDLEKRLAPEDFEAIEAEMAKIVSEKHAFECFEASREEATELLNDASQNYKIERLADIPADAEDWEKSEFPDKHRLKMYKLVLDEVARRSSRTPVALCREKRRVWEALAGDLKRMGQSPDNYVCNCGPVSIGCDGRLQKTMA